MMNKRMGKMNYHLKYSIIRCLLFLFLLPLLGQNLVNRQYFAKTLKTKINNLIDQTTESLSYSMSSALQAEFDIAAGMAGSTEIMRLAEGGQKQSIEVRRTALKYEVMQKMQAAKYAYPFSYIVANDEGDMMMQSFSISNGREDKRGRKFYEDQRLDAIWNSYSSMARFWTGEDYLMSKAGEQIYCVMNLVDSGHRYGIVAVNMDAAYLKKLLSRSLFSDRSGVYLLDKKGECLVEGNENGILYSSLPESVRNRMTKESNKWIIVNGEKYSIFRHSVKVKGMNDTWSMVSLIPVTDMYMEITHINTVNIVLIVMCIVSIIILIRFMYRKIFEPLNILNDMVKEISKGNLNVYVEEKAKGEIGDLTRAINTMSADLRESMNKIKEQEREKHQMEMRMLQAQIKPHFVRNTLNAIRWMAKLKGAEGVSRSILAFSNMLDYNFSDNNMFVKVSMELKYVEEYLYLQQVRFQNKFNYKIDVVEEMKDYNILKLSFQPIVENAISHGILQKKGMGFISMRGYIRGMEMIFEIIDDGIGMDASCVATVLEKKEDPENTEQNENIALWNISQRMNRTYGEKRWIEIESENGKGTCVRMIFPVINQVEGQIPEGEDGNAEVTDSR